MERVSNSGDQYEQVSVTEAEDAFNVFSAQLEAESRAFVGQTGEEAFDLRAYLQASQIQDEEGKPKHLGVSAKAVTVLGLAPESTSIANNLTPFLHLGNMVNPWYWCAIFLHFHPNLRLGCRRRLQQRS